ncbi:MAG: TVP38/TMEM64 family protein [Lysinibacillus sp.]
MFDWVTIENYEQLESYYRTLGPIFGVFLPFIEAFLPFLPLFVIIVANVNAFGLLWGFIISWIGSVLGGYAVFYVVRKFGHNRRLHFITKKPSVQKFISWVDMNGLSPLFVLLCFPFTPSVLVNIVAGLSNISRKLYFIALFLGKAVMIFLMSMIGQDITELFKNPQKLIISLVAIALLWVIGKWVEKYLNKRVERDLRKAARTNKKR